MQRLAFRWGFAGSDWQPCDHHSPLQLLSQSHRCCFPSLGFGAWPLTQPEAASRNVCGRGAWGLAEHYVKNGMYIFIFPWHCFFFLSLLGFCFVFSVSYRALYSLFKKSANSVEMVKMWLDILKSSCVLDTLPHSTLIAVSCLPETLPKITHLLENKVACSEWSFTEVGQIAKFCVLSPGAGARRTCSFGLPTSQGFLQEGWPGAWKGQPLIFQ